MRLSRTEVLLAVAATAGLGAPFLLIAVAQTAMSTQVMAAGRLVLAAAALVLLLARRPGPRVPEHGAGMGEPGRDAGMRGLVRTVRDRPVALGVVAVTAAVTPNLLIGAAERHVPSGTAAVILATTPLWIAVLGSMSRQGDRLTRRQWLSLPVAIGGVALTTGAAVPAQARLWCLLPLAAAIGYAVSNLTVRRHLADVSPVALTAAEMIVGAVVLVPVAAAHPGEVRWQPAAWVALVVAGIGCSGLGWLANTALVQRIGAARSSFVSYTAVIMSVLLGVAVLREPVNARLGLGVVLMLAAVAAFLSGPARKNRYMLELSILGFLAEAPMHAYELRRRISALTGHVRTVSDGALSPALKRLAARGLLRTRQEPGTGGPPRTIFELTDTGRDELRHRLAEPERLQITDRNSFFTILAFLHLLPDSARQRAVLERRLAFIEEPGRAFFVPEDRGASSIFRDGMHAMAAATWTAERAWLHRALREI